MYTYLATTHRTSGRPDPAKVLAYDLYAARFAVESAAAAVEIDPAGLAALMRENADQAYALLAALHPERRAVQAIAYAEYANHMVPGLAIQSEEVLARWDAAIARRKAA